MACHEIAALRLGMMNVLGIQDEAERQHELAELGEAADAPGPLRALCGSMDLAALKRFFDASLADLEAKVAATPADDPKLGYLRTLLVLCRKTEMELARHAESLVGFHRDLEEMHDFVHELYPVE